MGLFDFFRSNPDGIFVSTKSFARNILNQMEMTPMTLTQLRKNNVSQDTELKLDYFFYTNNVEKAKKLSEELLKLNYKVEYRLDEQKRKQFIITGETTNIKMTDSIVLKWTADMCELGYKCDCEFDGWGTLLPDEKIKS